MDLGYIPIVVTDAYGSRDKAAARRALDSLAFAESSLQTDVQTIYAFVERAHARDVRRVWSGRVSVDARFVCPARRLVLTVVRRVRS